MNILLYGEGNPGAYSFLKEVDSIENADDKKVVTDTLENGKSLRGTNLWVLYSDLCGQEINKVVTLCSKCPIEVLEDACSRQDYSGRKLVEPYLN